MTSAIAYIRQTYNVPAKLRGRVYVNGWPATIVGTASARLLVRLDSGGPARVYHPTDPALTYPATELRHAQV